MKIKKLLLYVLMCLFTLTLLLYILVNIFAGAGRKMDHPIELGNIQIPKQRSLSFSNHSKLKQKILDGWTSKTPQDWKPNEKVNLKNSRIAISCLLEGKRIEEINNYLMNQKAVGHPGSPWFLTGSSWFLAGFLTVMVSLYTFIRKSLYTF